MYTGGRDGLVLSWDLGMPLKRRTRRYGIPETSELRRTVGTWEIMTGWADDIIEEEAEDDEYRSDGDILGDVQDHSGRSRRRLKALNPAEMLYEEQWETDMDLFQPGKAGFVNFRFQVLVIYRIHLRFLNSVRAYRLIRTGSTICCYATTIRPASLRCEMQHSLSDSAS